jgi:hypothetical protein
MENRIFSRSMMFSFVLHFIVIALVCIQNFKTKNNMEIKRPEMVYVSANFKPIPSSVHKIESVLKKEDTRIQENLLKKSSPKIDFPGIKSGSLSRGIPSVSETSKKLPTTIPSLGQKQSVSVPMIGSEQMTDPRYMGYQDKIREKIKNRASRYIADRDIEQGEVYLTFVLLSDGTLKDTRIIDRRTKANQYLRSVGMKSIVDSNPFPSFPGDLPYRELSFNVVICFEDGTNVR